MYYYQFNCSRISWLLPECVVMLLLSWSYHKMVWLHSVGKLNYWYASYFYLFVISDSIVFISIKTGGMSSHSWCFRKGNDWSLQAKFGININNWVHTRMRLRTNLYKDSDSKFEKAVTSTLNECLTRIKYADYRECSLQQRHSKVVGVERKKHHTVATCVSRRCY